jgi:hypothetical protein
MEKSKPSISFVISFLPLRLCIFFRRCERYFGGRHGVLLLPLQSSGNGNERFLQEVPERRLRSGSSTAFSLLDAICQKKKKNSFVSILILKVQSIVINLLLLVYCYQSIVISLLLSIYCCLFIVFTFQSIIVNRLLLSIDCYQAVSPLELLEDVFRGRVFAGIIIVINILIYCNQ